MHTLNNFVDEINGLEKDVNEVCPFYLYVQLEGRFVASTGIHISGFIYKVELVIMWNAVSERF